MKPQFYLIDAGLCAIICFNWPLSSVADVAADYQSAQQYIQSQQLLKNLQVASQDKNLPVSMDTHPNEESYYAHPEEIANAAHNEVNQSESIGKVVTQSALTRDRFTINEKAPEIKAAETIQNNATAIADGSYPDCNKEDVSQTEYIHKTCVTGHPYKVSCLRTQAVEIKAETKTIYQSTSLPGQVIPPRSASLALATEVQQGELTRIHVYVHDGSNPWSCSRSYTLNVNGNPISSYHGKCGKYLGELRFDADGLSIPIQGGNISFSLTGAFLSGTLSGSLEVSFREEKKVPVKTWTSTCADLPSSCQMSSQQCIEPNVTKIIDGVSITEACWRFVEVQQCGGTLSESCRTLQDQGCMQVASQCTKSVEAACQLYSDTWSCPIQKKIGSGIRCGEQFFCMDGSCQPTVHEDNKDFGKSITELSAVNESGKQLSEQNVAPGTSANAIRLFGGEAAECSIDATHVVDCCADRGWGKGLLGGCTDKEKQLGEAKEKGLATPLIGTYCHNRVAGVCVENRKSYCVFQNKLALDVQLQGRLNQLHHGFGEAEKPDCSGITVEELSHINFGQIDFTNIERAAKNLGQLPDDAKIDQIIQNVNRHVEQSAEKQTPYSMGGL